jgi:hypothetical protein
VNPHFHDEFIALCALFFAGELTDEEWALLQVHLAYCDSCLERFEEYQRQSSDVIPLMAASASSQPEGVVDTSGCSLEASEQLLMVQLNTAPAKKIKKANRERGTIESIDGDGRWTHGRTRHEQADPS